MNQADADPPDIVDDRDARRWQARIDGEVVGYAEYRLSAGRITFTHTVVPPEYEGRGIASRLARRALDDALERGLRITPRCPFIRAYVRRHGEYLPQVDFPPEHAPPSAESSAE